MTSDFSVSIHFSKYTGCPGQRRVHPRRWPLILLWLLLALVPAGIATPATAQTLPQSRTADSPYTRALTLVADGHLTEALAMLDAWHPATQAEREQKLWGQASILRRVGRTAEALPLLERLVAQRPDVARFRIALAEVLAETGQTDRARLHLEDSFGGVVSDADQGRARKLLATLDRGKMVSGHVSISLVPSSNAAQRTNARTVTIGGRNFVVANSARQQPATGLALEAGVTLAPTLGPRTRLRFALSGEAQIFDGGAQDELKAKAELALQFDPSDRLSLEVGVAYARRLLDGDGYSQAPGLFFGLSAFPDRQSRVQFGGVVEDLRHDVATGLDGLRSLAVLSYARAVTPQLQLRASVGGERMDAAAPSSAFSAVWAGVGASYYFRGGLRISTDASLRRARYDGLSPLFGLARRDTQARASVELSHSRFSKFGFAPVIGAEYTRRSSNIVIYSYDELSLKLGLTRRF